MSCIIFNFHIIKIHVQNSIFKCKWITKWRWNISFAIVHNWLICRFNFYPNLTLTHVFHIRVILELRYQLLFCIKSEYLLLLFHSVLFYFAFDVEQDHIEAFLIIIMNLEMNDVSIWVLGDAANEGMCKTNWKFLCKTNDISDLFNIAVVCCFSRPPCCLLVSVFC